MNFHGEISEHVVIFLGQEFATDDEAYNFYNTYVRNNDFNVRKKELINHGGLRMKLFVENIIAIRRASRIWVIKNKDQLSY